MKFPKIVGLPRTIVFNDKEYLKFINLHNGIKKSIFESVYKCDIIKNSADFNNVEINKLFFDFDLEYSWVEANKFYLYLKKNKIKHSVLFSGGGYHIFVYTIPYKAKNIKSCIYNSQTYFIDKLNLKCDSQILGDSSRLRRTPNTYNRRRNRFCIPLTEEQFEKGDEFIKQFAKNQNFVTNTMIGKELFDISKFDVKQENEDFITIDDNFADSYNADYFNNAPDCIQRLLLDENAGWKQRYLIILFYKERGYSRNEVHEILKKHLSPRKLAHCTQEERQLQYLFSRDDLVFPSCDSIKIDGYCKSKCKKYNIVIYK